MLVVGFMLLLLSIPRRMGVTHADACGMSRKPLEHTLEALRLQVPAPAFAATSSRLLWAHRGVCLHAEALATVCSPRLRCKGGSNQRLKCCQGYASCT